jgi:hypothetical protein
MLEIQKKKNIIKKSNYYLETFRVVMAYSLTKKYNLVANFKSIKYRLKITQFIYMM